MGFRLGTALDEVLRTHVRAMNLTGGAVLMLIGLAMVTGLWAGLMGAMQGWVGGFVTRI